MVHCCHLQLSAAARQPAACSKQVQCPSLQPRSFNSRRPAFGVGSKPGFGLQRRSQQRRAVQGVLEQSALPADHVRYETMIILRPDMTDEDRDKELAKFEAFLNNQECKEIKALVRGRQPLAYPIYGNWEGIYVLYTYAARASVSPKVQKMLSTPESGNEKTLLRHMTFRT